MRIKYTYIANDGAEFNSQEECVVHEERLAIKNLQVIKNRINGIENFEGYWAELYLINSREDYEDVLFYLGEDAKGKLTTNFNNDNLGWFIHWVEPGEGKPDEHYLLNYKYYFRSIHENLMLFDKRIQEEISKRDSTKERENNTSEKTIKEPEPQYPTKKHGYYTRKNIGITKYTYGIVVVPEDWVLPYLKDLYARLTDMRGKS